MNKLQEDVTEFHRAFDYPAPERPVFELTDELKGLLIKRADWLIEEAHELIQAVQDGNLVGVLDAFGDSLYFGVGGFVVLGQDLETFWDNIQDANMAKLGPDGKPVPHPTYPGKIGKPEGWIPPEERHESALEWIKVNDLVEHGEGELPMSTIEQIP